MGELHTSESVISEILFNNLNQRTPELCCQGACGLATPQFVCVFIQLSKNSEVTLQWSWCSRCFHAQWLASPSKTGVFIRHYIHISHILWVMLWFDHCYLLNYPLRKQMDASIWKNSLSLSPGTSLKMISSRVLSNLSRRRQEDVRREREKGDEEVKRKLKRGQKNKWRCSRFRRRGVEVKPCQRGERGAQSSHSGPTWASPVGWSRGLECHI